MSRNSQLKGSAEMPELTLPPDLSHPFSLAGRMDPYPAYRWFQENSPVHFDKMSRLWFVTPHAGCAAALSDRRFSASLGQRERTRDDDLPASMLTSDLPDHARLRGPGALLLGPAVLRLAAHGISEAANRVVSRLAGQDEADATVDIGEPFAVEVFAGLFALPSGQKATFADLARKVSVNLDPLAGRAIGQAGRAAVGDFSAFMDQHIAELQASGADCPLTRLADDRRLSRSEMLGIVSLTVIGGFLPLADLVGHAAYWITAEGQTFACLGDASRNGAEHQSAAGGAGMTDAVIDELMRLATPLPFTARVTSEAVELDGASLPPGSRVLLVIAAANRDPAVFAHPGAFDPRRSPNPHLAFGAGPHLCLGAPLVRLAGGALLRELAIRFPGLRQLGDAEWDKPLVPRRLRGQRLVLQQ
jgi:pimeloyl-[acyl-carrier protein] synthase